MKTFDDYLNQTQEIGVVEQIFPSLVYVSGLPRAKPKELVVFETGDVGQVISLTQGHVEVVLFANSNMGVGVRVARTEQEFQIPLSQGILGSVINPIGQAVLGSHVPAGDTELRVVDVEPLKMQGRQVIKEPLDTGVTLVDMGVPLAKGQRQLILGDGKIGKTPFLRQVMLSHALRGGICIYAAIAKRYHEISDLKLFMESKNILPNSVLVASSARDTAGLIYQTPYSAMSIAEYFRDLGQDVLVIFDDLTLHAKYYREMMLMAKRFPGRSAYPGDIFYIHARLMERGGNFEKGSITCLPVAETVEGDISGYIQTNLMSMTDGHIFFDIELYNQGRRPAINSFLSVTRVGHQAQSAMFKSLSRELSRFMSQHKQTEELMHFGGEMGEEAKRVLALGDKVRVMFNQEGGIIPKEIAACVMAGLWGGWWEQDTLTSFQQKFTQLVNAYLTDQNYQQQVGQLLTMAQSFEELTQQVQSQQQMFIGQ